MTARPQDYRFESEQAFANSFIRNAPPTLWTAESKVSGFLRCVAESTCSDGRADWVWASSDACWKSLSIRGAEGLLQNPACSRILSTLSRINNAEESFLLNSAGISKSTFRRLTDQLSNIGLIAIRSDQRYTLGEKWNLPKVEIVAFEFKLYDWKRAFYQATRYRTFAHRVFVVMPTYSIKRAEKAIDSFRSQNVGLISHDESGSKRIVHSLRRSPNSSSAYLQAMGMLSQSSS